MKILPAILLLGVVSFAQTHQHAPPASESTVDLEHLPAPQHIDGIGHSHIAITTKSPEAQQWFDQGLALLHCFWDYEALRAFEQAVRLDPDCAMCHWGVSNAVAFRGSAKEQAKSEMKKAHELAAKATDREQRYIRAYFESQEKDGEEGSKAFDHEMSALIDRYPDDLEAKLLLAGARLGGYDVKGDPRPGALGTQAMLREILRDHPDNAAANHYWIHAVESSGHPEWAIPAAEKLGKLAPSSGHMVHMPGHIFYRVGDYERAREIFLDAVRVDREYMERQHVALSDDWNYQHNIAYLMADLAEAGRYREAQEFAAKLMSFNKTVEKPDEFGFYVLQIEPAENRLAIRFGDWDRVIAHPMPLEVSQPEIGGVFRAYRDGLVMYAAGMKSGDAAKSDQLDALLWRISQEDLKDSAKSGRDRIAKILGAASLELRGYIASRAGDMDRAKKLLEQAYEKEKDLGYSEPPHYARPALEVLGEAYIRAGKFEDARAIFARVLKDRPKSGWALYGIAAAWEKEGKHEEAAKAYREFLAAWSHADSDLPQVRAARAHVSSETR